MDFEDSVKRLARDQSKIRGKKNLVVSQKAKRQAEYQRKQAARLRAEREWKKRMEEYQKHYMKKYDRALHMKTLVTGKLSPTSIYGEGDKIALPPSVLESLTSTESNNNVGNPWTFRIGILNPDYEFPASVLVQNLKPPKEDEEDAMMASDNDEDDMEAYRDEISHKYLAYTHCTVVEFTQDEGHVGIPEPIAKALLEPNNSKANKIPVKRTVDPAGASEGIPGTQEDQTPGHLAWGAFDIPDMSLEVTLLQLPKGRECTLVPTEEAIRNRFHSLKDVKLVLEQSLIRTRATLSVGDIVSTWHRGVQFDLNVTKLTPASYSAVTCINTDIEVEIGEANTMEEPQTMPQQSLSNTPATNSSSSGKLLGTGRTVGSSATASTDTLPTKVSEPTPMPVDLPEEPHPDQKESVCTIQIQHSGGNGKRRFLISETSVANLFSFAVSLVGRSDFRLVTRFPRRVFTKEKDQSVSLADVGIQQGQERFMIEFL